jgi:hypothetical protein
VCTSFLSTFIPDPKHDTPPRSSTLPTHLVLLPPTPPSPEGIPVESVYNHPTTLQVSTMSDVTNSTQTISVESEAPPDTPLIFRQFVKMLLDARQVGKGDSSPENKSHFIEHQSVPDCSYLEYDGKRIFEILFKALQPPQAKNKMPELILSCNTARCPVNSPSQLCLPMASLKDRSDTMSRK